MRTVLSAALVLVLCAGCEEDETRAPFAPNPDGSTRDARPGPGPSGGRDGSTSDGSTSDGGPAPTGCTDVAPADPDNELTVLPADPPFTLSAAYIRWLHEDCGNPTLLIGLTDGACEPGIGQQLLFAIERDAIGAAVTEGDFFLQPEPTPMRVTFSRPVAGAPEMRDVYGTCSPDVLGTITFESVAGAAGETWVARWAGVELGNCNLEAVDTALLDGRLELTLPEDFETACP